jgi:hypothetical protein
VVFSASAAVTSAVFGASTSATVFGFAGRAARSLTVDTAWDGAGLTVGGVGGRCFGRFFAAAVTTTAPFFALPLALPPVPALPLTAAIRAGEGDRDAEQHQCAAGRQRSASREQRGLSGPARHRGYCGSARLR